MTWETALTEVLARTRHDRFRVLCSAEWPDHKAYRRLILSMAGHPDPLPLAALPLAEMLPLVRKIAACPYRSRDAACGCSGHRCGLRFSQPSAIVSHIDCLDCVKRFDG
jgi:hypothetical protein